MKLNNYLFSHLSQSFFPIFLGLYFITSLIFLVKIASLTSIITINFFELFQFYLYVMPTIIFYTMPVSFFISLAITLSKISSEYELVVITSFGLNPLKILKIFLPISLILSFTILIISLGLIPKAKYLNDQFLEQKENQANFNIKASEFGQKFGDWLIYISSKKDKTYKQIKLFKTKDNTDQFIISKSAVLNNKNGELDFQLFDGKSFYMDKKEINQINYKQLSLSNNIQSSKESYNYSTSYRFWKDTLKEDINDANKFAFYILISLFPLLSLFLILVFGYFNPRYEKSKVILYSLLSIVFYYFLAKQLSDIFLLHSLYLLPLVWLSISYILYRQTIAKKY